MMAQQWRTAALCVALAAMTLGAAGCELLYLAGGKGKAKAMYKFNKNQRVLVLVEVREGIAAPPYLANNLADSIGKHLFKYHAVEMPVVSQDALVVLQTTRPEAYKKMGIADIAMATGADAVVCVNIAQFATPTTTDGSVGEGYAEAYVKVVDKKGVRLLGDPTGIHIMAHDAEMLVTDRDTSKTVQDLINQLSTQTGRMFHDYDLEDKEMNPSRLDAARQMGHPGE